MLAVAPVGFDHSLPWYFGAAVFAAWAAVMIALVYLIRRRVRALASRRTAGRPSNPPSAVRDDHAIGPGTDIELW